jgi:hypothetical protein
VVGVLASHDIPDKIDAYTRGFEQRILQYQEILAAGQWIAFSPYLGSSCCSKHYPEFTIEKG